MNREDLTPEEIKTLQHYRFQLAVFLGDGQTEWSFEPKVEVPSNKWRFSKGVHGLLTMQAPMRADKIMKIRMEIQRIDNLLTFHPLKNCG